MKTSIRNRRYFVQLQGLLLLTLIALLVGCGGEAEKSDVGGEPGDDPCASYQSSNPAGCAACHATAKSCAINTRAVTAEFAYASSHINLAAAGYAAPGDIADAECLVCHNETAHGDGAVDLVNLNDSSTLILTGDPDTDPAAAMILNAFCQGCHDNVGEPSTPPFTDMLVPTMVDNTAWTSSSHNGGATSCYGNGVFGCHSSGHGSKKIGLLAPHNVAANATTRHEEEEGFCFTCHDADGPAVTDMGSRYALPVNWVMLPTGYNMLDTLNDRHDVMPPEQAISGAKVECMNCHNPHADSPFQPFNPDPDPLDTASATAGMSPLSMACLDCHDNTYPAEVTPPTNMLVDIDFSYSGFDAHGPAIASGPILSWQTGAYPGGWTFECNDCHDPHPSPGFPGATAPTNYFGLKTPVTGMGGEALLALDDLFYDYLIPDYSFSTFDGADNANNGAFYCNTCHDRPGMFDKENCTGCHAHNDKL